MIRLECDPDISTDGDVDWAACNKCQKVKLVLEFYKKGNRRDSRCKGCILAAKAKARKMTRLSVMARRKRIRAMIDVEVGRVVETSTQVPSAGMGSLARLLQNLIFESILEHRK